MPEPRSIKRFTFKKFWNLLAKYHLASGAILILILFLYDSHLQASEGPCQSILTKSREQILSIWPNPSTQAQKILNRWEPLSIEGLSVVNGKSSPIHHAFVRLVGSKESQVSGVLGTLEVFRFQSGMKILRIIDLKNQIHLIDPESIPVDVLIPSLEPTEKEIKKLSRIRPVLSLTITPEKMRAALSENQNNKESSQLSQCEIQSLAKDIAESQLLPILKSDYLNIAAAGGAALLPAMFFWVATTSLRFYYDDAAYFLNHASNFYFSLLMMSYAHGAPSAFWPKQRQLWLATASGFVMGVNAFEEIDFGSGRLSGGAQIHSGPTGSDWTDFSFGAGGVITYWLATRIWEWKVRRDLHRDCYPKNE
jgi:hypothetical protein